MSETPIVPALAPETAQEINKTEYYYTSGEFARDINALQHGPEVQNKLNLQVVDPINPELWADETTTVQAPEYATPKPRAQEIEESLFGRPDAELLQYGVDITHGVEALRSAA
jgi:hypothetical protein